MQTCATSDIHQAFTSYNNPKGNADTERFMSTLFYAVSQVDAEVTARPEPMSFARRLA